MSRILAIDYGAKRCGLAVTDPLRLSINPQPVCAQAELLQRVRELADGGELGTVVLTRSTHRDGTANTVQGAITGFAERLRKALPEVAIAYQDEFGSSKEARTLLRERGVGKKRRAQKGALDSVAAGIILERYLLDAGIW